VRSAFSLAQRSEQTATLKTVFAQVA